MDEEDKEAVMARFRSRQVDLLVTTLVIEAGVDIPNATLNFIEHAERFGLSQLHQLRGRVARGGYPGYCFLAADIRGDDSRPRLDAMLQTTDGFKIAELDFRLRGPGELLGTRQHGLLDLRIGDLAADADLLTEVRRWDGDPRPSGRAPPPGQQGARPCVRSRGGLQLAGHGSLEARRLVRLPQS